MIPDQLITIYSSLILIFIGFVVPILGISLPLFNKGIEKLKRAYENNYLETKEKLSKLVKDVSLERKSNKQQANISETIGNLQKIQRDLRKSQRETRIKLIFLKPQNQIIILLLPLVLSLVSLGIAMRGVIVYKTFVISLLLFTIAILLFLRIIQILTEVQELVNREDEQRYEIYFERENHKITLLEKILHKTSSEPKERKVSGYIKKNEIESGLEIPLAVNRKHELGISTYNSEKDLSLRNLELGFGFPLEFEIEEGIRYELYKLENIVRFYITHLPASENRIHGKLMVTPLKTGVYNVKTWIKGDDMKTKRVNIKFKIIP